MQKFKKPTKQIACKPSPEKQLNHMIKSKKLELKYRLLEQKQNHLTWHQISSLSYWMIYCFILISH